MANARGATPKLTDEQVQRVLRWSADRLEFRNTFEPMSQLAHRLGVGPSVVRDCIVRNGRYCPTRSGRNRRLNDVQITQVLIWAAEVYAFRSIHPTALATARDLGVCVNTIRACIRCGGQYKARRRIRTLALPHHQPSNPAATSDLPEVAVRNVLLNSWKPGTNGSTDDQRNIEVGDVPSPTGVHHE